MPTVDLTRIGSNIGAMYSLQSLLDINNKLATHQTRLSTGKRLNSAMDDPAGLTIATKMNARSEGLKVVMDNISDAKNMLSVAESGLGKVTDILTKMRSKATQAASDTLGATERATIQTQLQQFAAQIDDLITETKWNGVGLLDGNVSKRFQTGVESNEFTNWQLSVKHDPTALGVSTVQANDTANNLNSPSNAFTAVDGTAPLFSGLTKLTTGSYQIAVKDVAAGATQGKISVVQNNLSVNAGTVTVSAHDGAAGAELANGQHTLEITGYDAASDTLSYKIDGVAATVVFTGTTAQLVNGSAQTIGIDLDLSAWVTTSAPTNVTGTYTFDYVRKGMAEVQLQYQDGTSVAVDSDGSSSTGGIANTFYIASGGTFDTGRGLQITAGALADLQARENETTHSSFNFAQKSDYSVDVSTADKAATYMSTLTNAMDIVNQSLAELGSLMARMTIKEEAASTSQINVEAAYNRIMNANMAEEQVNASKYLVLQQTAVAMLAQANQAPQFLLSLFR